MHLLCSVLRGVVMKVVEADCGGVVGLRFSLHLGGALSTPTSLRFRQRALSRHDVNLL
jgi:hypothetical protein